MNLLTKLVATARAVANHPLSPKPGLRAVWEFATAQVGARMIRGDIVVPFPNGTRLFVPPRMKGAAHFICPGLCEFDEMSFVAHFLRPADLFVDVGANIGAYTLLAAGVAGADVVAVEPSPSTFAALQSTIELNDCRNRVVARNLALGSKPGRLRLTEGLGTENHLQKNDAPTTGRSVEVEVSTLDAVLEGRLASLIKMDVEGFESEVIAGATGVLREPSLAGLIIERAANGDRYGFDEDKLHRGIQQLGFLPYAYSPFDRGLRRLDPAAQGNLIYLRDLVQTQGRLRNAPSYTFAGRRV